MEPPSRAAPDWSEPLLFLETSNWRITQRCALLARLGDHIDQHGVDAAARTTCKVLCQFFDEALTHHVDDEEIDLFPLLLRHAVPDAIPGLQDLVVELEGQHAEMGEAWAALRKAILALESGHTGWLDAPALAAFQHLYVNHLALEGRELLPLASKVLGPDELQALGQRFAARRLQHSAKL